MCTVPISIRTVRITEHVADMLTKGAFATFQWKSLRRLFDIHPHQIYSKVNNHTVIHSLVQQLQLFRPTKQVSQLGSPTRSTKHDQVKEVDLDSFWFEVCQDTKR